MSRRDLPALNIAELQTLLRRREVSPRDALEALHARIEDVEEKIDAYLSRDLEAALVEITSSPAPAEEPTVTRAVKGFLSLASHRANSRRPLPGGSSG